MNICCTIGIISITYVFTYKGFTHEKIHVMEEFLEIDSMAKYRYINDLNSFHTLFESMIRVSLEEAGRFRYCVYNRCRF